MSMNTTQLMDGSSGQRITDFVGAHMVEILSISERNTREPVRPITKVRLRVHQSQHPEIAAKLGSGEGEVFLAEAAFFGGGDSTGYYHADIKKLIGAIMSVDPASMEFDWDGHFKAAKEQDMFKGQYLLCTCFDSGSIHKQTDKNIKSGRAGKPILNIMWEKPEAAV